MNSNVLQTRWTRSREGWLAGVCQGLGERFDFNPGAIRLFWIISITAFGVGLPFYILCAFLMPHEDEPINESVILGVCFRLSQRMDIDVTLLRILTVMALFGSAGSLMLVYFVLHFLLPRSLNESI